MNYQISKRFKLILDILTNHSYPSKEKMIELLVRHDIDISERTLERDLMTLKTNFGIEYQYNRTHKGYEILKEYTSKEQIKSLFSYLEMISTAQVFSSSIEESNKTLHFVDFDNSVEFSGSEHLTTFIEAIQHEKEVSFVHQKFQTGIQKEYQIKPIKLKSYQNRWYVIGIPNNLDEIRVFGLDRIQNPLLRNTKRINPKKYEDQLEIFEHIIGLNRQNKKIEVIEIAFSEFQLNYIKSLPIHASQEITDEKFQDKTIVKFVLAINPEFKMKLLQYGQHAIVKSPNHLKEEMIIIYKEALMNYESN